MTRRDAIVIAGAVLLGLAGCAGSGGGPPEQGGVAPVAVAEPPGLELLSPGELVGEVDVPRRTAYTEEDLIWHGSEYNHLLPANRLTAAGDAVTFAAEWEPATGMAGAAYGIYSFTVAGFDREDLIEFGWDTPPPEADRVFIGLSDWDRNTWHWQGYGDGGQVSVDALADYFSVSDVLLLAVVSIGYNQDCTLRWVHLGTMPAAVAQLQLEATEAVAPVNQNFSGAGSQAGVGEITKYEWDFDGDGSFETDAGTDPFISHIYTEAGEYSPALRITTTYGEQPVDSGSFTVLSGWDHTFGSTSGEYCRAVAVDGDSIYLLGNTSTYGVGANEVLLLKYSREGEFQWARAWGGIQADNSAGLGIDAEGSVYVVNETHNWGLYGLALLKWSPTGELLSTTVWDSPDSDFWKAMKMHGSALYVLGKASGVGDPQLVRLDSSGEVQWARRFGTADEERAIDLAVSEEAGNVRIHTLVSSEDTLGEFRIHYCEFSDSGSLVDARVWTSAADELHPEALAVATSPRQVFISGQIGPSGMAEEFFLIEQLETGASVARRWKAGAGLTGDNTLLTVMGGFLLLGGALGDQARLLKVARNGSLLAAETYVGASDSSVLMNAAPITDNGLLIGGSIRLAATGGWQTDSLTAGDTPGSWAPLTVSIVEVAGTTTSPSGRVSVSTDGVQDTGGGALDAWLMMKAMP